jgi:translocation and assembly module TamA
MLWGLVAAAVAQSCSTAKEKPDQPLVKSLTIEGAKKVSTGEIKDKILTEESGWLWLPSWFPFFAARRYFDPNAWQGDLRRIERIYQSEGYFNARVVENQVIPTSKNEVELKIKVEEGEATRIRDLQVKGLDALPEEHRNHALKEIPLKQGDIFKEYIWEGVKGGIQSKLREDGYAEAVVNGAAYADIATQQAEIRIDAQAGQRYRFGDVFISTGPHPRVRASWIYQQATAAVKKGNWYSDSALVEAQARVFKMGVFGAVKVNRGAPDREEGTLPVVVDVREAPFHTLRAGGGLAVDQVRNEGRLLAEYTDRDFYGGLRKLTLRSKVGWAFIPNIFAAVGGSQTQATKSEPIYLVSAELEQPRFVFRDVRLETVLSSERGSEQAYSYIGGKAKVGFIWQPHSSFSIFPSYNLEADYLLSGQATLDGRTPALFFGPQCTQSTNCFVTLSYLEQAIVWDRRDNPVEPRKGYYISLNFQEGGGLLRGSFDYIRVRPEARYYKSFGREQKVTLAARIALGTLRPQGGSGSPILNRFFSGGDSMRGFNYRRLSPLFVIPQNPNNPQDGVAAPLGLPGVTVPIGGNGLFEGSLELRYNFAGDFVVAVFFDTGFVSALDIWRGLRQDASYFTRNLQYAVGIGLRYRTLVGPIRFDIGYRLPVGRPLTILEPPIPLTLPPAEQGCFFGLIPGSNTPQSAGYPEGRCAIHLSIGEAF